MPEPTSETPILDLEVPLSLCESQPVWPWWRWSLLGFGLSALAIAFGYFVSYMVNELVRPAIRPMAPYEVLLFLLALIAAPFIAIGLRDIARFAAGMVVGFHANVLALGPIVVSQKSGRVHFGRRRNDVPTGFMGINIGIRGVRKLRRKLVCYVAAGPLADLASVIGVAVIFGVDGLHGIPAWFKAVMLLWGAVSAIQTGWLIVDPQPRRSALGWCQVENAHHFPRIHPPPDMHSRY